MAIYRASVHEYIRACKALLNSPDLSEHEQQAVEKMARRFSEEFLTSGDETAP